MNKNEVATLVLILLIWGLSSTCLLLGILSKLQDIHQEIRKMNAHTKQDH